MILRASLINAQSTVALVKFFVTCVRIRRIIYEILCYPVIYWRALYTDNSNSTLPVTAITVVSYPLTLLWIILYVMICRSFY